MYVKSIKLKLLTATDKDSYANLKYCVNTEKTTAYVIHWNMTLVNYAMEHR